MNPIIQIVLVNSMYHKGMVCLYMEAFLYYGMLVEHIIIMKVPELAFFIQHYCGGDVHFLKMFPI